MSEDPRIFHAFTDASGQTIDVALPFELDALCDEYDALTARMARRPAPAAFSRDEWGYLLSFLRGDAIRAVFIDSFGPMGEGHGPARIARPPLTIAVWLPNNVSLLGPLTAALCLLTGARVSAKAGIASENLTAALRDEILNVGAGPVLTRMWENNLETERFDRLDPRNADWSASADARVFFGSDEAATKVEALPHVAGTPFFAFGNHSSLVWADPEALDDAALTMLLRVFRIYGKAGCTSPQRLVLIDGKAEQTIRIADRLKSLWDAQSTTLPPVHIASDSFMAEQVARAQGWHATRTQDGGAVFLADGASPDDLPGLMSLKIVAQPQQSAVDALPDNIQTVGHIAPDARIRDWARTLSNSRALRLVPVREMHHFGPFWDGQPFWRGLFQVMDVRT